MLQVNRAQNVYLLVVPVVAGVDSFSPGEDPVLAAIAFARYADGQRHVVALLPGGRRACLRLHGGLTCPLLQLTGFQMPDWGLHKQGLQPGLAAQGWERSSGTLTWGPPKRWSACCTRQGGQLALPPRTVWTALARERMVLPQQGSPMAARWKHRKLLVAGVALPAPGRVHSLQPMPLLASRPSTERRCRLACVCCAPGTLPWWRTAATL